jgi:hypothetical protein
MASFSDQISQFNPYIQQLPVDAMVKVGMYKQQQYDQGVQKVQTYVDNVAGMDVANDADKQYLQSKLNDLGSRLKIVAAGDFSNQQLVNSVGGMATSIIKDPTVQTAVLSTAELRKQTQLAKDDEEKGISNPYNTAEFNEGVNSYLNSKEAGKKFTTSYFKPRDVWKKLTDVADKVGVDSNIVKQLFKTDENGNRVMKPIYDKKGKKIGEEPEWNPIIATEKLKGKDAGKVLAAFQNALDPGDYKQLAINGKWSKQGETPLDLRDQIIDVTKEQINFASGKIDAIKSEIYKESQKNDKDEDKINLLKAQLEAFEKSHTNLVKSRDTNLAIVDSDPLDPNYNNSLNAVRSSLYTNSFLHSAATELSSKDKEIDYSVNPIFTVTMEQNKFNQQLNQDAIKNRQWQLSHDLAVKVAGNKELQDQVENYFKYGVGSLPAGFKRTDIIKDPIDVKDDAMYAKHQVENAYSKSIEELNASNSKLTVAWYKNVNPKLSSETDAEYNDRINKAIYRDAAANKEAVDATSGDVNTFTSRFAAKQLADWKKNKEGIPFEFRSTVAKQDGLIKDITTQQAQIQDVKSKAFKIAKEQGLDVPSDGDIKKNIKPTTVLVGGMPVTLTKDDVLDFASLHPEKFNVFGGWTIDKDQESQREQAKKRLKLKWGNLFQKLEDKVYDIHFSPGELGGTDRAMGVVNENVLQAGEFIKKSKYNQISKIESQLYNDAGLVKQPVSLPVLRGKENRDDINAKISTIISKYKTGLNETPGYNSETMQATLLEDGSVVKTKIIPGATEYDPNTYQLSVISKKTGKTMDVTIDEGDHEFLQGQKFENKVTPRVVKLIDMYGTSNISKSNDPNTAWFNDADFKNLEDNVSYTLTSDLVKDQDNSSVLWMKIYMHDKQTGNINTLTYPKPIPKYNADGSVNQDLNILPLGINNAVIQQIKSPKKPK